MGYVPRKVGVFSFKIPGRLIQPFPRWGFMVIFWNFAGVPFVSGHISAWCLRCWPVFVVLHLLCCIHGFTWSIQVSFLYSWLRAAVQYAPDCILHVCNSSASIHLLSWSQLTQLGHVHVAEESVQDADPRCLRVPEDIPSTSLGYSDGPSLHPDGSRVSFVLDSVRAWYS